MAEIGIILKPDVGGRRIPLALYTSTIVENPSGN